MSLLPPAFRTPDESTPLGRPLRLLPQPLVEGEVKPQNDWTCALDSDNPPKIKNHFEAKYTRQPKVGDVIRILATQDIDDMRRMVGHRTTILHVDEYAITFRSHTGMSWSMPLVEDNGTDNRWEFADQPAPAHYAGVRGAPFA